MDRTLRAHPQARIIGWIGLVGTVLLFTGVITGSPGEPPTDATSAAAAAFLRGLDTPWVRFADALAHVGVFVLLWFMVGLALLLRRVEGDLPLRSTMAALCGVLVAAYVILGSSGEAAARRAAELDQGQLAYAYDVTTIGFTNIWLPLGGFALACGAVVVACGGLPRWLGWWGLVSGAGLALVKLAWTNPFLWLIPYGAFWIWLVTTCVLLVRRPASLTLGDSPGAVTAPTARSGP
jgi:hypothetical protein